jgi:hypothetical protein
MFKHRAAGQRMFPSEPASLSMAPGPAPMTNSDSKSANLDYLHHVLGDEREGYVNGERRPPMFTALRDSAWAICSGD